MPEDHEMLLAERYLVAANMHNNEEVLPHFILQLIHLFAVLPPETAFLSIYESGSKDSTGTPAEQSQFCNSLLAVAARIGLQKFGIATCLNPVRCRKRLLMEGCVQVHGWKCCRACSWPCTSRTE